MKDNAKTGYHSMKSAGSKVRQIHPAWNIINVHRGERAFTVSLKKLTESHLSTYNPKHSVSTRAAVDLDKTLRECGGLV